MYPSPSRFDANFFDVVFSSSSFPIDSKYQSGGYGAGVQNHSSPVGSRRTPYEVWCDKNRDKFERKKTVIATRFLPMYERCIPLKACNNNCVCVCVFLRLISSQHPKLNSEQWDRLVDKMHNANRIKQRYCATLDVFPRWPCLVYGPDEMLLP